MTRDHVPPRAFFSKPCPPDMLTVPACETCNASFKKDDEYTHMVVALDFRAASHRDVLGNMSTLARSLQRPQARGFTQSLVKNSRSTGLLTPSGASVRKMTVDVSRIDATGEHIVRGLHYVETKMTVDPKARVLVRSLPHVEPSDPMLLAAVRMHDLCPDQRHREVGKAFSYGVGFGYGKSVWIMMLYGYHFWFATIGEPPEDLVDEGALLLDENLAPAAHTGQSQ